MKFKSLSEISGSLRLKTTAIFLFIFLAASALAAKEITDFQKEQFLKQANSEASLLAGILEEDLSEAMVRGEPHRIQKVLEKAGERQHLSGIWLTDRKGSVFASSRPGDVGRKAEALPFLTAFGAGRDMALSRTFQINNGSRCAGCHGSGQVIGNLTVGISYTKAFSGLLMLKKWLLLGSLLFAAFASLWFVAVVTSFFTRPAHQLAAAMERAGADVGVPLEGRHSGDFRRLFDGFNSLMAGIKAKSESSRREHLSELRKYSVELESINRSLDEKINRLSALSGISRSMNATHRLDELLKMIINSATRELKADSGSIMLFERSIGELFIHTGKGLSPEGHRKNRFLIGEGIAGWVAENREPAIVADVYADPRYVPGPGFKHRKSLVSVPLISSVGDVLGVINLERGLASHPFRHGDLDYLTAIAGQASVAVENVELFQNLQKSYYDTIYALAQAVEAKDPYTVGHCERVTQYSIAIGEELGLSGEDIDVLRYGATLHDLGKIGISEAVLNKPGKLTEEEFEIMKEHAAIGENIVRGVDFLQQVRPIIRNHQERWDGAGYPDGLKGGEIPLAVAIVTLADNFDALTSDRPYRPAKPLMETINMIKAESGTKYNPKVVESFLKIFGEEDRCRLTA